MWQSCIAKNNDVKNSCTFLIHKKFIHKVQKNLALLIHKKIEQLKKGHPFSNGPSLTGLEIMTLGK